MPATGAVPAVTAMLAAVTGPDEAEIALAGGADIIHVTTLSVAALPERVAAVVAAVAGRGRVSAAAGALPDLAAESAAVAVTGVDAVMVPIRDGSWDPGKIHAVAAAIAPARPIAVVFADADADFATRIPGLAAAGFHGVLLDIADRSGGRLVARLDAGALAGFVATARDHGLQVGLAGSLEAPDVPRMLALRPDFLGFRSALCAGQDPLATIELGAVQAIRALIPRSDLEEDTTEKDEPLPAARARLERSGSREISERIFVRDFVLPVRIGAYRYEHDAPQNVRFDVSVDVQRARGAPQGMAQVFSYDLITDGIRAIVAEGHVELVESLADRIAALALSHKRAKRVTVRVTKLERGPGGVGVEIVVERPGTEAELQALLASLQDSAPKPQP